MTTENESPTPRQLPDGVDPHLTFLVETINLYGDATWDVTLTVGGLLISGKMISGREWYQRQIDALATKNADLDMWPTATFVQFRDMYKADEWPSDDDDQVDEQSLPDVPPTTIHLADAFIIQSTTHANVGLWRGLLSSVDGYNFGLMQNGKAE
ncbi:hypothetical protein ACTHQY_11445 [Rhodococcoides corynebacterioides]|uniref:hypothetical protein n=1 Tax=Rhodococcoides corynebacterioides TaxID=53972 RepID=UPI003F820334